MGIISLLSLSCIFLVSVPILVGGETPLVGNPTKPFSFKKEQNAMAANWQDQQLTQEPIGHHLTNIHCWSFDGRWIVYDVRSTKDGSRFDGDRIRYVEWETGTESTLYQSERNACCGVATCSPTDGRIVFIHGPEAPDADWSYSFQHRRGVILYPEGSTQTLDACNLVAPFQPGALRGGSHVHVFSKDGQWISFTYNDDLLNRLDLANSPIEHDRDQRNIGMSVPLRAVKTDRNHPRNHDGSYFSILVTKTVNEPAPGSDEICKAYEEGWVGTNGYRKSDGTWQKRALTFLGDVILPDGTMAAELFIIDLPESMEALTVPGEGPLGGTQTRRPMPPKNVMQQRLTRTNDRKYPGVQGPRHWPRSSPDGAKIAFLMKDDSGIVQIWTVSPNGGEPVPWTANKHDIASMFSWSPDGKEIVYAMDNSIFVSNSEGETVQLTSRSEDEDAPIPYAVVFSPDGTKIAYGRNVLHENGNRYNQIFIVPRYAK